MAGDLEVDVVIRCNALCKPPASPAVVVKVEENWDYYAGLRRRRGGAGKMKASDK